MTVDTTLPCLKNGKNGTALHQNICACPTPGLHLQLWLVPPMRPCSPWQASVICVLDVVQVAAGSMWALRSAELLHRQHGGKHGCKHRPPCNPALPDWHWGAHLPQLPLPEPWRFMVSLMGRPVAE